MKKTNIYICFTLIATLYGCSSSINDNSNLGTISQSISNSYSPEITSNFIQNAENSETDSEAIDNYLLALNSVTSYATLDKAQNIINEIKKLNLDPLQKNTLTILNEKKDLLKGQPLSAIKHLERITSHDSSLNEAYDATLMQAYSDSKNVTKALIFAQNIADLEIRNEATITMLQQQEEPTLEQALKNNTDEQNKGWIKFALLSQTKSSIEAIHEWQKNYPNHPANSFITNKPIAEKKQTNIALLLPLEGELANTTNKIAQGFLASYYDDKSTNNNNISVKIKDTSDSNITDAFQAINDTPIDIVITGLGKDKIEDFSIFPEKTKIIYLGNSNENNNKNVYYFSLSLTNETKEIANSMFNNGFNKILVLSTTDTLSQKISNTFIDTWSDFGGNYLKTTLEDRANFASSLKQSFNIDESENKANELEKIINQKFKFVPTRRNDIDAIFLATNAIDAREIKPLLKYYFAGDIPVFAVSNIFNTSSNSYKDKDLNGVIFKDSEWLVKTSQDKNIKSNLQKLWGQDFQDQKRVYALGIDLYRITTNLDKMILLPQSQIPGATGKLSLTNNNTITRELDWLKFYRGIPKKNQTLH